MPQDVGKLFLNGFTVAEKRASEAPPLTIDMLGRRIGNNFGTERQRSLHDWRCQRIVDDKFPVGGMGEFSDPLDVDDRKRWIGEAFKKS